MSPPILIAICAGVATVMAAVVGFFATRSTLKATQPKTNAEADLAQANANTQNVTAQGLVIDRLDKENARLGRQLTEALGRIDALEAKLGTADEQNNLQARQLVVTLEQVTVLKDQKRILTAGLHQLGDWTTRYYQAGHPPGMEPPPAVQTFV